MNIGISPLILASIALDPKPMGGENEKNWGDPYNGQLLTKASGQFSWRRLYSLHAMLE